MKTVKSIRAAESFLRKLAGQSCSFVIRTTNGTMVLTSGRIVCSASYSIKVETEEAIKVDSGLQPTLQLAFDRVSEAITKERSRRAIQKNADAIKRLASRMPEVRR